MPDDLLKNYRNILSEDIQDICQPLQKAGISFFHYLKKFNDNSRIHLTNKPEWVEYYYQQRFYMIGSLEGKNELYKSSTYFMWVTAKNQVIFKDVRDNYNIDHGITFIKKNEDSIELFHFGVDKKHSELINFYLSNLNFLDRFIVYFKDRASKLIAKAEKQPIMPPAYNKQVDRDDLLLFRGRKFEETLDFKNEFIRSTRPKKVIFHVGKKEIILSMREVDCLFGVLEGKTAQEIGKKLFISKRTIETHLDNIRHKLNCQDRSELFKIILDQGRQIEDFIWKVFL